jgi:hypothetical protein
MQYKVVFDVLDQPYPWSAPAWGLGVLVIGASWIAAIRWWTKATGRKRLFLNALLIVTVAFGIIWTCGVFVSTRQAYERAWDTHRSGRDHIVEGVIASATPTPGHKAEKVSINNVVFTLSDYSIHPGYNMTSGAGGLLRIGTQVRIHYSDNEILELEVTQ